MRFVSALLICLALFLPGSNTAQADIKDLPDHDHGASPICANPVVGCDASQNHNHRTAHPIDGTGAVAHGDRFRYKATSTWMDDRADHNKFNGHGDFGHGHMDNSVRFKVITAVEGGQISGSEASAWNAGAAARVNQAFSLWNVVGNAGGAKNWKTGDNDHAAGDGVKWHSSLQFVPTASKLFEISVFLGEASVGFGCDGDGTIGCWDFRDNAGKGTPNLILDDDVSWYFGTSTNKTVAPNDYDALSALIHEVGHAVGFMHFGTFQKSGIMRGDLPLGTRDEEGPFTTDGGDGNGAGIFRTIDESAIHGVRDLYAISGVGAHPVPLPASLWLFGAGLLGLFGFNRRTGERVTNKRGR